MFIGLPGSGKTTAAKKYHDSSPNHPNIFEADMFFINFKGEYNWNPKELNKAHQWCQNEVKKSMIKREDVIVSNTFLTPKDRAPYLKLVKEFNYDIEVYTCTGNFQNEHGVPEKTIEKMKQKFVPYSENELKNI